MSKETEAREWQLEGGVYSAEIIEGHQIADMVDIIFDQDDPAAYMEEYLPTPPHEPDIQTKPVLGRRIRNALFIGGILIGSAVVIKEIIASIPKNNIF